MIGDGQRGEDQQTSDQRTSIARRHTDAAEAWLRRIIDQKLGETFGQGYFDASPPINGGIRGQVERRIEAEPGRFPRKIDATTFDEAIDIVSNPYLYREYFDRVFREMYPIGREQLRCYLKRLSGIRNHTAHGRGCSSRQVEQAVCYANDLIDAIKEYFRTVNMEKRYNVPSFVRFCDNLGNEHNMDGIATNADSRYINWRAAGNGDLHPGDVLIAEVEVDPSFDPSEYSVSWRVFGDWPTRDALGMVARVEIQNKHVGEQFELVFQVVTSRDWHRFLNSDERLGLLYRVLPPAP